MCLDSLHIPIFPAFLEGEEVCSLTARVQRGESATARCASTEDQQAPSPRPPCPPIPSYGIMPLFGEGDGTFA
jgi:hypothetical protein